jgi:GT2 family glycosyltransferase
MVVGWAYDPLRPSLELRLRIDGQHPVGGLTGYQVHPEVFAESTPPVAHCGFQLPLPTGVYDGWKHQLHVEVMDWSTQPSAPKATLTWHSDGCFGEFTPPAQPGAALSGWVGFRGTLPQALPKVLVHRDQRLLLTLPLHAQPNVNRDGCSHIFGFSTEQLAGLDWRSLQFSCQGTVLRKRAAPNQTHLLGAIEHIRPDGLRGWALDMADPLALQDLLLLIDNEPQATVRPNIVRSDILRELKLLPEEAAFAGFDFSLPPLLKDGRVHHVNLLSRGTGTLLMNKPMAYQHQVPGLSLEEARQLAQSGGANATLPPPRFIPGKSTSVAKPEVSIVILNRNGGPCLDHLFASFERHNSVPVEFIVIDHASTDSSLRVLQQWQSKLPLQVVALDHNASFSASCNRGAKLARANTLLFLNNDIVWQHDALPDMLATLNDKKVSAVGLRLLKTTFNTDGSLRLSKQSPEVQHLGIRFMLVDDCYWPYEVTPETDSDVPAFAPAAMPGVTGAVLLCRKQRFWQVGGFDERYVYGYEDVELCLRLKQRGTLICHNDAVALHHHGYTRLTGREPGMQINHVNNQERLADQIGLWLKRHFWRDLRAGTHQLSGEALTIGLVTGPLHGAAGNAALDAALALADKLEHALPHARLLILSADRHWQQVQDCHVLLALHPAYDLRQLQQPRADLRTACVITGSDALAAWLHNPSFARFDRYLVLDPKLAAKGSMLPESRMLRSTAAKPLGDLLDDKLRVVLQGTAQACQNAFALRLKQELQNAGALVYEQYIDSEADDELRVNEVTITLFDKSLAALDPTYVPPKTPASLSILVLDTQLPLDAEALTQADEIWLTQKSLAAKLRAHAGKLWQPDKTARTLVDRLQDKVEQKIGRSLHTP